MCYNSLRVKYSKCNGCYSVADKTNSMIILTEDQINKIPVLVRQGKKAKEISKLYGCALRTAQYWIKRWHLEGKLPKPLRGREPVKMSAS